MSEKRSMMFGGFLKNSKWAQAVLLAPKRFGNVSRKPCEMPESRSGIYIILFIKKRTGPCSADFPYLIFCGGESCGAPRWLFALIPGFFACVCFLMRQINGAVILGWGLLIVGAGLPCAYFLNFFLSLNKQAVGKVPAWYIP